MKFSGKMWLMIILKVTKKHALHFFWKTHFLQNHRGRSNWPTPAFLGSKKDKDTVYNIGSKSKGLFESKLFPGPSAFLPNLNSFRYKIGIQFSNTPLIVEQNNCTTKTLNFSIVYDLYDGPRIPLRNFTIKNWFFGATNLAKNIDKIKRVCSSY